MAVVFAAGGTGGHLMPALTVARGLDLKPHFIVSSKPIDIKLLKESSFEYTCLPLTGTSSLLDWINAMAKTFRVLSKLRPKVVVGFGGFVSVLPILVGRLLNAKCIIFEAELEFGKANKLLRHFAHTVLTVDKIQGCKRCLSVGYPVREQFFSVQHRPVSASLTVFVQGGSQGAEFFDLTLSRMLSTNVRIQKIFHQARSENVELVREIYKRASKDCVVKDFFDKPWEELSQSDLVITRAGAGSVYEVFVSGKPWVVVPFPFSAGEHQRKNAAWLLQNCPKGIILEQEDQDFNTKLSAFINQLLAKNHKIDPVDENQLVQKVEEFRSSAGRIRDTIKALLT